MTGHWIYRDKDVHRCSKPAWEPGGRKGDVWKCDECGKEWVVTRVDYDQRDNTSWFTWAEYESWKSGPFPPGTK